MTAFPIDNRHTHGEAHAADASHAGTHDHAHEDMGFIKKYIFSTDHKTIGIQFLLIGLFFFVIGGLLALLVRWQLGFQGHAVPILGAYMKAKGLWSDTTMPADFYTMAFSMHGSLMIFFVVIPLLVGTFGNYLIPLKIGAPDMAFPFLNGMAFWLAVPAGTIMVAAFFIQGGASQSGWTAYPPLSSIDMSGSGGQVPWVAPTTPWERAIDFLRIHETGAAIVAGTDTFEKGVFTQQFTGDADKLAQAAGAAGEALKDTTSGVFKGASLVSHDKNGLVAKLADGKTLTLSINRQGGTSGTVTVKVGDEGVKAASNAFLGRVTKILADNTKPDAAVRWGWQSSWSAIPLLTNLFALFMAFMYICAYYVRIVPSSKSGVLFGLKKSIGTLALTVAGALFLIFVLSAIFPEHRLSTLLNHVADGRVATYGSLLLMLLLVEGAILFFGGGINHHVSVVIAGVAAFFALKGVQRAAFDGQACWFLSVIILGFSSIMGAVNYLTTVVKLRCPGMTMFRLPLSVWSLFITSILVLLATPVLAGVLTMNLLDHHRLTGFFQPFNWVTSNHAELGWAGVGTAGGGYPILHQHLFWFYSHPAVYIMILPAMGMVSDVLAVFARKPVFGYRPMVYAMAAIAFLGFIVWAHHMFQSGMNPTLGTTFAISTMFIAVPSAIKVFNWLGTLWGGNIRFTSAMLNAIAFVSAFVIGGLSGIFMASTAIDVHIHDTYFIVAHIHYVLFGGSLFGIFAAIYFWYPKMFGRMMSEWLGQIHFWLTFVAFNCTFFTMHILGIGGMARRIADYMNYPSFQHWKPMNQFISISAFVLGVAQIPFAINFIGSWIWGKKAPNNPWDATTLEWNDTTSPPPHGNFVTVPVVHHGPYEYSTPLVEEDWLAQTRPVEGAEQFQPVGH